MIDYSKVKFVKPSVDGEDITKGKVYDTYESDVWTIPCIKDDVGDERAILIGEPARCYHLDRFGIWIPCDENGKELSDGI